MFYIVFCYTEENIIFTKKTAVFWQQPSDECGLESHELSPLILGIE
jgi:hypothetical protein